MELNIYGWIILTALILEYSIGLISDVLNLRALSKELPEEFSEVYDEDRYARSQEYTRVRTRFGFITSSFDLLLLLVVWFGGYFNALDQWVRSFGYEPLINGLLFIFILVIAKSVISLPFSIYSTFVIEERFDFNKTSPKTFVVDLLKGLLLSTVIGIPVLSGILYFFMYTGELAWLYAWGAVTIFTLIMQYVAPTWIMPLFNKFTPLEEGELRTAIEDYTDKVDFPLAGLFVIDGSKRSSKSNAFFTGFGKNKRIALFDTLIDNHSIPELVAVLAHEIGHYKKKHILKNMLTSIIHTGILFYLLSVFLDLRPLFDAFFMQEMSVYAGLIFFGLLYTPVEMILSVVMSYFSRKHEFEADEFASRTISEKENMVMTLKKLSKDNLSNLTPHPVYVFLNYSHPPVIERIRAIRRINT